MWCKLDIHPPTLTTFQNSFLNQFDCFLVFGYPLHPTATKLYEHNLLACSVLIDGQDPD